MTTPGATPTTLTDAELITLVTTIYLRGWDDGYAAIQGPHDGLRATFRYLGLHTPEDTP